MNYRHIYHAGNFADIFKHFISYFIAKQFLKKDSGFLILDAFAGPSLYPLNSTEALKTEEYKNGIELFMGYDFQNEHLKEFQSYLKPMWEQNIYKGSPLQLQSFLRAQDRLIANELHPDDFKSLSRNIGHFSNVSSTNIDAYISVKSAIPPREKRGFILVDPPFEKRDEFEILMKNIKKWHRKFSTGVYAIWYPIKAHDLSLELIEEAKSIGFHRSYAFEFLRFPRDTEHSFNGCGMLVFNAPYLIPEVIKDVSTELDHCLNGKTSIEALTTE